VVDSGGQRAYASPSMERIFSSDGPLVGKNVVSLVEPETARRSGAGSSRDAFRTAAEISRGAVADCGNQPFAFWKFHGSNLLHDPDVTGIVFNARDITERHLMEEQLPAGAAHGGDRNAFRRSGSRLQQSLTVIRGYTHELMGEGGNPARCWQTPSALTKRRSARRA